MDYVSTKTKINGHRVSSVNMDMNSFSKNMDMNKNKTSRGSYVCNRFGCTCGEHFRTFMCSWVSIAWDAAMQCTSTTALPSGVYLTLALLIAGSCPRRWASTFPHHRCVSVSITHCLKYVWCCSFADTVWKLVPQQSMEVNE